VTDAELKEYLATRHVQRALHFTTNRGLAGILAVRYVFSREKLPQEEYLEHIYTPNCTIRKDPDHLGYVNLSISEINGRFFDICADSWHAGEDIWWAVLRFDADVLTHDGVVFTTTNNMYTGVRRGTGRSGIEPLFADAVYPFIPNTRTIRRVGRPENAPTDRQAEALYPDRLSTSWLREIVVREPAHEEKVAAMLEAVAHSPVEILCAPAVFQ
jgi:hypothetical protein